MFASREQSVRPHRSPHKVLRGATLILLAATLSGCMYFRPVRQSRGNLIDNVDLAQLQPGTSTRADVTSLVGTPTTHATFDDNTWIYVGEVTKPTIAGFPAIIRQEVVVMNFDGNGTLRTLHKLTGKDAVRVAMVSRTTPSPGSEASFLQQVIGNVGRYNPAGLLGGGGLNEPGGINGSAGGQGGTGNTLP
jgi:outer membrane protein assembly factor BamE (lipoprotein component of BamABCDE complex)